MTIELPLNLSLDMAQLGTQEQEERSEGEQNKSTR